MTISHFEANHFRNLTHIKFVPSESYNLFYGANGSGKTSILEAIYHLGLGRSFRTRVFDRIIQDNFDAFSIFSVISSIPAGIERNINGDLRIKIANDEVHSIAELANLLPLQLINSESFQLINAGPKIRREFIDWGMFHVEHSTFMPLWKRAQRVLKQRNAILRNTKLAGGVLTSDARKQLSLWSEELIEVSNKVDRCRQAHIEIFVPVFLEVLGELLEIEGLRLAYYSGWDEKKLFQDVLKETVFRDIQLGYTQYGPHRADLVILVNEAPIQEILSRGQQKLVVCAMRLSQALLLDRLKQKKSIFLIDDLPAELDSEKRKAVFRILEQLKTQVFVTGIEKEALAGSLQAGEFAMFHVEHGSILG